MNYLVDYQWVVISDHFLILHLRKDFCVNISKGSAKTINHRPTHVAVEQGKNAVLCCWALHLNKTTVKKLASKGFLLLLMGKPVLQSPFNMWFFTLNKASSLLCHCSSAYFQNIQISQTLKELLLERRDKVSESGCHFTAKPPSPMLLWKALSTAIVYIWGVKVEPNFYV